MLILWDSKNTPPEHNGVLYRWNGYDEQNHNYSLLGYVETHRERLRLMYLNWLHALGEANIRGRRIIDRLAFKDGLSYWWLSIFIEKSSYNFPTVNIVRLLALEEIIVNHKPRIFCLVSSDRKLHLVLRNFCRQVGIKYEWKKQRVESRSVSRDRIYQTLPHVLQGLLSLVRCLRASLPFKKMPPAPWLQDNHSMLICGYFANIEKTGISDGRFRSRYWEQLHELMAELGIAGNWLHHNPTETPDVAMKWIERFNKSPQQGVHSFVNASLSWNTVFIVIKKWTWLIVASCRLKKKDLKSAFCLPNSKLCLWPLLQEYWKSTLYGSDAVSNLFSLVCFDVAFSKLPHQKLGLYLCENKGWERGLIHAWKKYNHGTLIAVPHTTTIFLLSN